MRTSTITKEVYLRRQEIIRNRMIKVFQSRVEHVILRYYLSTAAHVRSHGIYSAQGMIHGDTVLNGLTTTIQALYKIAVQMAIKKPVVSTKAFPTWLQTVFGFLDKYILNKVVLPISMTTISDVNDVLQEGIESGMGSAEMVKRLEDSELPKQRARMIVRTETVRATNVAQIVKATQSPYDTEKQWIAVEDSRTRLSHSNHGGVDGERVGLFEPYSNGLYFPGDPNGDAKETINCRCTQGFFAKRDEDGNLVRSSSNAEIELAKLFN